MCVKDCYLHQINIFYQQIQSTFAVLKLEEMLWQLAKGVLMNLLLLA